MAAKHKILIVDDNPGLLAVCTAVLTTGGHDVTSAEDGFVGLLALEKSVPDLIICDLHLPRMSGFEFLSVVRRRFPEVRVMAMSGAYVGDKRSGGVLADAFYSKGQSTKTFLGAVGVLLNAPAPHRRPQELAEVWIPCDSPHSAGELYVVISCTDCFRTFPLAVTSDASPDVLMATCFFCGVQVRYSNEFSRTGSVAAETPIPKPTPSQAEEIALEATTGAFEDEIASQVPFI